MKIKLVLIIVFIASSFLALSQEHNHQHKNVYSGKRVEVKNNHSGVINSLLKTGIDLRCGAVYKGDIIILDLTNSEIESLQKNNIEYKVIIDDLTKFYVERAKREMPKAQSDLKTEKLKSKLAAKSKLKSKTTNSISSTVIDSYLQYYEENEKDWAVPTNFNIPSTFGGCLTVDGMVKELDSMKSKFPNLITVKTDASPTNQKTYGYTGSGGWAGQTIYYVKISDNPDGADDPNEPDILYTSMIHSRELSSLMGNIFFMWYLLENYATDSAIKHLVDNNELFFVPVVNPDGLRWNEKSNPNGGGMNRTNLRGYPNATNNSSYQENYGVDPNRNFNYLWGSAGDSNGSSSNYQWSTYRGPTAFSEPESQIMRDFILSKNFKTAVWQHSYANAVPHPYGGIPTKVSGREDEMARWHQDMTRYNRYISGAQVLTPANGIADDWMLGGTVDGNGSTGSGMNILATTPENGANNGTEGGFWPAPTQIVPIAKRMVRINLMNAYYGGKYAKLHDLTPSNITTTTSNLTFGIERVGQTASDFTITVTPISSNIASVGSAVTETGMNVLEQRNINIQLNLNAGLSANDKIEYKVTLSNADGAIYEANFEKYYQPTVLFQDNPDSDGITNWTSSGIWTTVTSGAWSGTSIKDGSAIPYATSGTRTLTTANTYNLSGATKTLIQFYAKWDLERNYDFVEILGSPNGGTNWYSLNGKYNKPNASSFTNSAHDNYFSNDKDAYYNFQNTNSSGLVYDGDQMDNWVMEEIVIDPTNNAEIFGATNAIFRFRFVSDGNNRTENYSTTYDGFYFDDFRIIKVQEPCVLSVPTNLAASSINNTSATITWNNIPSATYDVRYRTSGGTWDELTHTNLSSTSVNLTGLTVGTTYEVQVRAKCDANNSAWSSTLNFTTTFNYCNSFSNDSSAEYISGVNIEGTVKTSGSSASGYSDYTSGSSNPFVFPDLDKSNLGNYFIEISKDFVGGPWNEAVAVWIDFNRNGAFEASEKIFDSPSSTTTPVSTTFDVSGAQVGQTRMRVILKYYSSGNQTITDPCEEGFNYGEVEDYTINIIDSTLGIQDELLSQFTLFPNPTKEQINLTLPQKIVEFNVEVSNMMGQKVYTEEVKLYGTNKHSFNLRNVNAGVYFVKISTNLGKASKKIIIQ